MTRPTPERLLELFTMHADHFGGDEIEDLLREINALRMDLTIAINYSKGSDQDYERACDERDQLKSKLTQSEAEMEDENRAIKSHLAASEAARARMRSTLHKVIEITGHARDSLEDLDFAMSTSLDARFEIASKCKEALAADQALSKEDV